MSHGTNLFGVRNALTRPRKHNLCESAETGTRHRTADVSAESMRMLKKFGAEPRKRIGCQCRHRENVEHFKLKEETVAGNIADSWRSNHAASRVNWYATIPFDQLMQEHRGAETRLGMSIDRCITRGTSRHPKGRKKQCKNSVGQLHETPKQSKTHTGFQAAKQG